MVISCPGFGQDEADFSYRTCEGVEPEATWAFLGCYSLQPHLTTQGGSKGFFYQEEGGGGSQLEKKV